MKRTRLVIDPTTNTVREADEYYAEKAAKQHASAAYVMPDLGSFISPLDGKEISSRSQLREHEKKHNVRQVGNDWSLSDYDVSKAKRESSPASERALETAFRVGLGKSGLL